MVCSYGFLNQCFVRQLCAVCNPLHNIREYALHFIGAAIEAESKFVDVTLHVLPAHVVVNAMITALEQRPKRFNTVRVAIAVHIFLCAVVNRCVIELRFKAFSI